MRKLNEAPTELLTRLAEIVERSQARRKESGASEKYREIKPKANTSLDEFAI